MAITSASPAGYAANLGMALSTNRKNRVLRVPATKINPVDQVLTPRLPFFSLGSNRHKPLRPVASDYSEACTFGPWAAKELGRRTVDVYQRACQRGIDSRRRQKPIDHAICMVMAAGPAIAEAVLRSRMPSILP